MDFEKIMQWMELAKKYQTTDFWNSVFDQSTMSQFMNDSGENSTPFNPSPNSSRNQNFPYIDIYMNEEDIILVADLAGYKKEDLQVSVSGNKLMLKGSLKQYVTGQPIIQERNHGDFQRIITLPEPAEPSLIQAKFENGLLILTYRRQFNEEQPVNIL
ncbi:Hsp20/alpha crystallin family protein [Peribacillus glennii]|uniref:Hsp20/alpha crystallin family protein n=1 Tax=Peribacillus glennii TaxID=2303991 RepID=A0A372L7G7_9BACI|nr:Hsp20/alpha crystallin family protein [Peribacillus glennii]RFU60559.1 Hsp20/alpha crystallin family protein [Peribacillus glennii]